MFKQAIISLLVFTASFYLYAQDTTAPVLHNIYVSPSIINAGDSITVTIEITDDISGIRGVGFPNSQNLGGTFAHISTNNGEFLQWATDWSYVSVNTYKSTILIPSNVSGGLWKVSGFRAEDIAGNIKAYGDSIDFFARFTVNSSFIVTDTTAPQLLSIYVVDDTVEVPQFLFFKTQILETESGLKTGDCQLFMSNPNCSKFERAAVYTQDSIGNWISETFFDKWQQGGIWTIDSIKLYDNVLNKMTYYNGIHYNAQFYVIEQTPDCFPPEFLSVSLSPNVLHRGDTLSIFLEMRDTVSGLNIVDNGTDVDFENQYGQQRYGASNFTNLNGNVYKSNTIISEYASNGHWNILNVSIRDNANNFNTLWYWALSSFNIKYEVIPDSLRIIEGTILTSDSLPLKNSKVFMIKQNPIDSNIYVMRLAFTDTTGYYRFESEKRDSLIYLKAIPNLNLYPNQIPTYLDSTILFSNARMVHVSNILSTIDTFHTLQGTNEGGFGFISGFLSDGAGKRSSGPLANMDLILATITGEPINGAKTNSDGYFSFQNIPNGTYIIYPAVRNPDFSQAPVFYINDTSRYTLLDFAFLNNYIALSTTSVEAIELNYLKIYPNPVNEKLIVEYRSIKPSDFELYDIVGKEIDINIESQINKVLIDFSKVKSGTYLLKTSMKSGDSKVSRILVE